MAQLNKINSLALTTFPRERVLSVVRGPALQWIIAAMVGMGLGLYVVGISLFPQKYIPLFGAIVFGIPFLIIFGHLRELLLAVVLLDIPFQLDKYLFYREDIADLAVLGGLNVSVATFALIALYAWWFADLLSKREFPPRWLFISSLPLALYLGVVTLSATVAYDVDLAFFEIFLLWQTFFVYIYVVNFARTWQNLLLVIALILFGLLLESVIMVGLRGIGRSISVGPVLARIDPSSRVGGTVGSPNDASAYVSLLLAPALSLLLTPLGRWYKWLAGFAFCFGVIALIFTSSRGGWIAFAVSMLIFCFFAWYRGWLSLTVPVTLALFAILIGIIFQDAITARFDGDDDGSAYSRIPLMIMASQMIQDNMMLGVGANNFAAVMMQYAYLPLSGAWLNTVHNKYLLVWAETGILGLVTFIGFLLTILYRGWQALQFNHRVLSLLALGFTAGIMGQMVHMTVDLFHSRPAVQLLWVVAGVVTAINNLCREGENINT